MNIANALQTGEIMKESIYQPYIGKTVGFVGTGISNTPILKAMTERGIRCVVRDRKNPTEDPEHWTLEEKGVRYFCGESYLEGISEDVLFLAPAVRPDQPALLEAKARGVRLTSEMEAFFAFCPCKKIGITGSDGKTTTTTLISKILQAAGKTVFLGGNIGRNLFTQADSMSPDDFAVVELSSFQLFKMTRSPDIAVITNLAPNHLDWHRGMDEYAAAKAAILTYQSAGGIAILNADDGYAPYYAQKAPGAIRYISGNRKLEDGFWFDGEGIHKGSELILKDTDILMVGRHNRYNYTAAAAALDGLVPARAIREVARSFGGVEHRIEFVREFKGVRFYNSSIDSSPSRTTACLNSFPDRVVIICGGYDKKIPLEPLGPLFKEHVKHAVLCGATAEKIRTVLDAEGFQDYEMTDDFEAAVHAAFASASPGECVVLSPAAASFDRFRNFEERGNVFKNIVNHLH